jgi:predicted transcriptional regulator
MSGSRRPDGALEDAVMRVLWASPEALLPATIRDELPMELAYTSVATVLGRLVEKGLVGREPTGNAFRYSAFVDEGTLTAQRMRAVLDQSSNHRTALAGFVNQLGTRDARLLRALLDEQES